MITELGLPLLALLFAAVLLGLGVVLVIAGFVRGAREEPHLERRHYYDADGHIREGIFEVRNWVGGYETARLVGTPRD